MINPIEIRTEVLLTTDFCEQNRWNICHLPFFKLVSWFQFLIVVCAVSQGFFFFFLVITKPWQSVIRTEMLESWETAAVFKYLVSCLRWQYFLESIDTYNFKITMFWPNFMEEVHASGLNNKDGSLTRKLRHIVQTFGVDTFFKEVSYAYKSCIYFIKNTKIQ